MLAYGFLALEQLREKEAPASPGKKTRLANLTGANDVERA
jgi:hypothetical protein